MPEIPHTATDTAQMRLSRRSPYYWRVTLDHPPLNIFGPDTISQLDEVITAIEVDRDLKVVVFDSAVEGFFCNCSGVWVREERGDTFTTTVRSNRSGQVEEDIQLLQLAGASNRE